MAQIITPPPTTDTDLTDQAWVPPEQQVDVDDDAKIEPEPVELDGEDDGIIFFFGED